MQVERRELLDLLRSRDNEKAARRAAETLPQSIDLTRDRALLRRCGIDPNVLAAILTRGAPGARSAATVVNTPEPEVRRQLTLSSQDVDAALDGLTRAFFEPAVPAPGSQRLQHISSVVVVAAMLFVVGTATVLAGVPAGAAAAFGAAVILTAAVLVVRRRSRGQTRPQASRQEA